MGYGLWLGVSYEIHPPLRISSAVVLSSMDYVDDLNRVLKYIGKDRPIRYNHDAFLKPIQQDPTDHISRKVYADYLEENDPNVAHPDTLNFLRTNEGPAYVHRNEEGQVSAGPLNNILTSEMVQDEMKRLDMHNHSLVGSPVNGPNGSAFVTSAPHPVTKEPQYMTRVWNHDHNDIEPYDNYGPYDNPKFAVAKANERAFAPHYAPQPAAV